MSSIYSAILTGDRLEWKGRGPRLQQPVEVTVTVPDEADLLSPEERRRRMVEALEELAALGGFESIPDPVAWQREMRKDRPLPGRDE
jgi:hypothetical protein